MTSTTKLDYYCNNKCFEAFVVCPDESKPHPTVLICHAWAGRDSFVEDMAGKFAELGYTAIALDTYGKGVYGNTVDEKMALLQPLLDDRAELQARLKAGVELAHSLDYVNTSKLAAIGYCFGGLCVLDMARMGLPLKSVISVHGLFVPPTNLSDYKISSKVLALHGHLDPMVSPATLADFTQELDNAQADWQINNYGKALHAFTNPEANDHNLGTVYNEDVAKRAWGAIRNFLTETL